MAGSLEILFRYRSSHRPDVEGLIASVQEVFTANGASVSFERGADSPLDTSEMDAVSVGDCVVPIGRHRDLFDAVAPVTSPSQAVVFIVSRIIGGSALSGCAAHPASCPGVLITEAAADGAGRSASSGAWILAHEIGHLLGLRHTDRRDLTSLMCDPATDIVGAMPRLSSDDCRLVERSQLLGSSHAGPRPLSLTGLRGPSLGSTNSDGIEPRTILEEPLADRTLPTFPSRTRTLLDRLIP